MSTKTQNRGFTLIELLVVIAIIGILASVVLASLNTARDKAKDAAAKSSISQTRSGAEVGYNSNSNSYANLCPQADASVGSASGADKILTTLAGAASAFGVVFDATVYDTEAAATPDVAGDTSCQSDSDEFVAQVLLTNGNTFCVDSVGFAGEITPKQADLADGSKRCQ